MQHKKIFFKSYKDILQYFRDTLFLPTTREQKYKIRQAICTIFWLTNEGFFDAHAEV